jgi:hypothetical protein
MKISPDNPHATPFFDWNLAIIRKLNNYLTNSK